MKHRELSTEKMKQLFHVSVFSTNESTQEMLLLQQKQLNIKRQIYKNLSH